MWSACPVGGTYKYFAGACLDTKLMAFKLPSRELQASEFQKYQSWEPLIYIYIYIFESLPNE